KRRPVRVGWPFLALGESFADLLANLAPAEEGRIDEALVGKFGEGIAIFAKMLRLAADRGFPCQAKPAKIVVNALLQRMRAARGVDIFHAQQKTSVALCRHIRIQEGGIGMAKMQLAIGTGSKAEDRLGHGRFNVCCRGRLSVSVADVS